MINEEVARKIFPRILDLGIFDRNFDFVLGEYD